MPEVAQPDGSEDVVGQLRHSSGADDATYGIGDIVGTARCVAKAGRGGEGEIGVQG